MKTEKALEKHSYLEVSMRKRMFLQLFEDGGGVGSGGQVETLEQVTAAREMPVDQEIRAHTALRRQKRLPMREQTEPKKRHFVLIFSSRE